MKVRRPVMKHIVVMMVCLLAASVALASRCVNEGAGRVSVQGTVTFDGQAVEKAAISFVPLPGTNSPTAGADVVDGQFVIPAKKGVFPGKFRVQITAGRPTGKQVYNPLLEKMVDEHEQYVPPRYNTNSELEVDVERGAENRFEFPLVSQ